MAAICALCRNIDNNDIATRALYDSHSSKSPAPTLAMVIVAAVCFGALFGGPLRKQLHAAPLAASSGPFITTHQALNSDNIRAIFPFITTAAHTERLAAQQPR
ncbi:hypothetical protein BM1_03343 [Bipolaris maydis]|uniref:uncharacterized protein n=1 Tax=Cochliobolus heterostrophus TaxID=5016 RepID=UPI0024DD259F|nr:hypothetical protein BM1_03343 [Bipolaris maydis]KAJ5021596.1 hypothetical protein J3E73DRAFT_375078 [Bipolaris maydis]KAJ6265695.1 hypothetical protein PSV08DRAFT_356735 [Bipolaris maydis]KAJ6276932.1 hypothetical protein J3E71DRAFT_347919 [Bipolaris maydis]